VPGSSVEDRRLGQRLVAKELAALGEVYDLYSSAVYGVALKVTAERRAAEEVTREVFLDLWRRPGCFDANVSQLRPWLAMRAHRRAVESVRQRSRAPRNERMAIDLDRVIDVDEIVQSVLKTEEVRAALAALPEDERTAIRLAYFAGKNYREVAADLGVPDDIVKARMCSGLRRLASSLPAEVVEEER
jgi:RNA polymerase sigma factor (sigma-70 family)